MQKKLSFKIQPENHTDFQNDDLIIQTAIDIEKIIIEEFQIKQKNIDMSKLYFVRRNFVEKKVLYNKNNKSPPKDNDIKKIIKNNAINDFTISIHIFDLLHNFKNHTDLDISSFMW